MANRKRQIYVLMVSATILFATVTLFRAVFHTLPAVSANEIQPLLVKDINLSGDSSPAELTDVNGTLFFTAEDSTVRGLWKSDGTEGGTVLIKDPTSPYLHQLTNVDGLLFFETYDTIHGWELWRSDGTEAGTVMVKDINPSGNTSLAQLTNVNGTLFFKADDGVHGEELWKSDGTEIGTVLVKDIDPTGESSPGGLLNMNGTLLFKANDGIYGRELWKSDGTEIGTAMVKDINPAGGASPGDFADVNGTLFFSAMDGVHFGLWTSDGTANGTTLAFSFANKFSSLYKLTHAGGTLFFSAHDPIHGRELWKSDGTADGTIMVKEIATVPFPTPGWDASPLYLTSVNNTLFFVANDGIHGYELWRSDGTEAGTVMVKDINPSGDASLGQLTNVNGTLFFKANDGIHGSELWKSDGTEASTVMVQDINPSGDASPGKLTVVDGKLFFKADDGVHGNELWATETIDSCPDDSNKLDPGMCGCGVAETDTDSDGYPDCIDCRSDDPISYPMAPEVYDGIDNNCNGRVDEGCGPTPAEITELDPSHGGYGTKIKIKGSGFGEQQTGIIEPGRGFYSIVSFSYSGYPMPLVATRYGKWTNTALRVALEKLFMDLNADGLQQYDEPFIGILQPDTVTITFSSIHFEDVNANGTYDEDDSIIEAVTSNTQEFSLTDAPVIKSVTSVDGTIAPASTIVVRGYGFQSSQGDSSFFINNAEFGSGHKRIKLWTDTKIKVKIPFKNKLCQWYKHGDGEYRKRKVWVTVGGINSNVKRIKVNRPAGCESCTENADCEPGQYCAKPLGSCETSGDCTPLPDYCFDLWAPVCGCDGNTYSNSCTAASWGVNVAYEGECLP